MLDEYTRALSGVPKMVWPGKLRKPTHVIFHTSAGRTDRIYTWSEWAASFCERAYQEKFPIKVAYSETAWGKLLIDVDYAEHELEPAS
jgi:hypothetical protein